MNFGIYALAVLSNLLVVYVLPDHQIREFLKAYSLASMAMGIAVVYAFSTPRLARALQAIRLPLCAMLIALAIGLGGVAELAAVYACSILLSDYYVTQCGKPAHVLVYRWFMVLSVVPALMSWTQYREHLILLRTLGTLLMLASLSVGGRPLELLKIGNPIFYILSTHVLYFGSLALVSWTVSANGLRAWYVGSQVGQGLVLKLIDYKARSSASSTSRYQWAVHVMAVLIGIGLSIYSWQPWALLTYAASVLLLTGVARVARVP